MPAQMEQVWTTLDYVSITLGHVVGTFPGPEETIPLSFEHSQNCRSDSVSIVDDPVELLCFRSLIACQRADLCSNLCSSRSQAVETLDLVLAPTYLLSVKGTEMIPMSSRVRAFVCRGRVGVCAREIWVKSPRVCRRRGK